MGTIMLKLFCIIKDSCSQVNTDAEFDLTTDFNYYSAH